MATTQKTNHAPATYTRAEYERKLREAIEAADRGEAMSVSEADEEAIRQEIEDLERRNEQGGTSPTLERLIREHNAKLAAARA